MTRWTRPRPTPYVARMRLALLVAILSAAAPAAAQPTAVQSADPYFTAGREAVRAAMARRPNTRRAKNVILFVGDGMGLSTVTASRIFEGQSRGVDGESNMLSFERLPYSALSKTYSTDTQVADSAATATALMTGVKTRNRLIGVGPATTPSDCVSAGANPVTTLAELARARGKAAGVVTTTRLTHATPASVYAHVAWREWESDADMSEAARALGCSDIARQLVEAPERARLNVAFGGGRARFQGPALQGRRADGRDLTTEWAAAPRSAYVADAAGLAALRRGRADHVLGLFDADHMPDAEVRPATVPSLAAMTTTAIDLLSADRDGFFLLVEGGKIDHHNHANHARGALTETVDFARAIEAALAKVDLRDTLVIVTADHSHGLVINGYAPRNAPILGTAGDEDEGREPYTTLTYATGPGGPARGAPGASAGAGDTTARGYRQLATVHLPSAAHSGEDVPIYAGGPWAHLLEGVVEESYVFHVMRHALGL